MPDVSRALRLSRRSGPCAFLPHNRQNGLRPPIVPLDDAFELVAPRYGHAEAVNKKVADFVHTVAPSQTPIDLDRLTRPDADDLAGDDRSIRIQSAAGYPREGAVGGEIRQSVTVGVYDVRLEEGEKLLLLHWTQHPRKTAQNKPAEAGDVEVLSEQLAKPCKPLRCRGISRDGLELVTEVVDEGDRVATGCGRGRECECRREGQHCCETEMSQHVNHLSGIWPLKK